MTDFPDDLFSPTTPPTPGAAARKCRRHQWSQQPIGYRPNLCDCGVAEMFGVIWQGHRMGGDVAGLPPCPADENTEWRTACARCGAIRDEARAKLGRNNRARGGRAELEVARSIPGASKVGPLGHPWDVDIPGYMRLQVKKLAAWPSIAQALIWLDAIPPSAAMRGVAVVQAGRKPRRLLLLDLDEFAVWYGDPTKGGRR